MPIVRPQAHCLSSTAFNPRRVLGCTFETAQEALALSSRHLNTSKKEDERNEETLAEAHLGPALGDVVDDSEISIKRTLPTEPSSTSSRLSDALQAIRNRNRNSLIRKVKHRDGNDLINLPEDASAREREEAAITNFKIHYLNNLVPNKTLRPQHTGSHDGSTTFQSPIQRFKARQQVFQSLKFYDAPHSDSLAAKKITQANGQSILDYDGRAVQPTSTGASIPECMPWANGTEHLVGEARLEAEIRNFHSYVFPSDEEIEARRHVANEVASIIKEISSKQYRNIYSSELFGSVTTGTALATSDIDIRLVDRRISSLHWAPSVSYRKRMRTVLSTLETQFRRRGYKNIGLVHARYPLVTMVHPDSRIKIQIVASNSDNAQKQVIRSWVSSNPQILPVFATIKSALEVRALTDVFHGGISSYPLLILVRASMQLKPATTLARHFLNFLDFFSTFDTNKKVIGPNPFPRIFNKISDPNDIPALRYPNTSDERYVHAMWELSAANPSMPFLPCIQDPADKHNDVGRRTFAWKHIVETFKFLKADIDSKLAEVDAEQKEPFLLKSVSTYHAMFQRQREQTQNFGLKLLSEENKTPILAKATLSKGQSEQTNGRNSPGQRGPKPKIGWPQERDDLSSTSSQEESTASPFNLSRQKPSSLPISPDLGGIARASNAIQQSRQFHTMADISSSFGINTASFKSWTLFTSPRWGGHVHYMRDRLYSTSDNGSKHLSDLPDLQNGESSQNNHAATTSFHSLVTEICEVIPELDTDISFFENRVRRMEKRSARRIPQQQKLNPIDEIAQSVVEPDEDAEEWPSVSEEHTDLLTADGSKFEDTDTSDPIQTTKSYFNANHRLNQADVFARDITPFLGEAESANTTRIAADTVGTREAHKNARSREQSKTGSKDQSAATKSRVIADLHATLRLADDDRW